MVAPKLKPGAVLVGRSRRGDLNGSVQSRNNSLGNRVRQTQWRANGNHVVTNVDLVAVCKDDWGESSWCINFDHSQVDGRVGSNESRRINATVEGLHFDFWRTGCAVKSNHVRVGKNVTVGGQELAAAVAAL